jgi:hypothetical protein
MDRQGRQFALASGFGLFVIGLAVMARGGTSLTPRPGATLRGPRAAVHEELERREALVPYGRPDHDYWRAHLDVVTEELAQGHIDSAVRAWHDAYGAALQSRSWQSMIAVGDTFMAIGRASHSVRGARMNAREAYLAALIRARRDQSVEGALRSAQAFREIEDNALADQCLYIAGQLAMGDPDAEQRVQRTRQHWATPHYAEY